MTRWRSPALGLALLLLSVSLAGARGPWMLAAAVGLAVLAAAVAWLLAGLAVPTLWAAAAAPLTVLHAPHALVPGLLLVAVGLAHRTRSYAPLLVLAPVGLLLPEPGPWVAPPVLAAAVLAGAQLRHAWLALPVASLPLILEPSVTPVLIGIAGLGVGVTARVIAGSPANLAMARRVALGGLALAPLPAVLGVVYATVVPGLAFAASMMLAAVSLAAGLLLASAHVGLGALLAARQRASLWLAVAWAPLVCLLVLAARTSLTTVLGPATGALSVLAPVAGLGVATVLKRSSSGSTGAGPGRSVHPGL